MTTPATPFARTAQRVTFRAGVRERGYIEALAASMDATASDVIRAGLARLYADLPLEARKRHQ